MNETSGAYRIVPRNQRCISDRAEKPTVHIGSCRDTITDSATGNDGFATTGRVKYVPRVLHGYQDIYRNWQKR